MTNEEIYKYAWKSGSYGDKLQKKQLNPILGTALLFLIGIFMFAIPLTHSNLLIEGIGCLFMFIMVIVYFSVLMKKTINDKKKLTDYEYNLVRQDERNRIASDELFNEGSK